MDHHPAHDNRIPWCLHEEICTYACIYVYSIIHKLTSWYNWQPFIYSVHTYVCTFIIYVGHRCQIPGCGLAFVVDGNMKNHRDVCLATNAGYAEYNGLPGRVRTSCPNYPDYKSSYCSKHKPNIAIRQCLSITEDEPVDNGRNNQEPAGFITSKRTTRNNTRCVTMHLD